MSRVLEVLAWWLALTVLELMLVSAVDRYELLVAVLLGLGAAGVAVAARRAQPTSWRMRPRWLAWLLPLPVSIVSDTGRVLAAAARGERGSWRSMPVTEAAGDDGRSRGARAFGALVLSASPGTVIIDVDAQTGAARMHDLGGSAGSPLERAVSP